MVGLGCGEERGEAELLLLTLKSRKKRKKRGGRVWTPIMTMMINVGAKYDEDDLRDEDVEARDQEENGKKRDGVGSLSSPF